MSLRHQLELIEVAPSAEVIEVVAFVREKFINLVKKPLQECNHYIFMLTFYHHDKKSAEFPLGYTSCKYG
jgi:hypothetical protein